MSLANQSIPEETRRIAKASFPKGNGYLRLRDESGPLFSNDDFADLMSWKGEEGISAAILATMTVLQYAEGWSDRQVAEQGRSRIDWKYLLGVEITYAGFDFSVLSRFRERLLAANAEKRLFELPLQRMREMGLVRGRGSQRTDSTHVLAQIRVLNRLELVGETIRHALNEAAILAPEWLASWIPSEWMKRYGTRIEEAKLPQDQSERIALAKTIGQDGYRLLSALLEVNVPAELLDSLAIQMLRMVWIQQYSGPENQGEWRESKDMPPASYMINSPYDPDAQYSRKRKINWTGYKVHLTESCDEELPHLITHVETTAATVPDFAVLPEIEQKLVQKGLPPAEHAIDAGYTTAKNLVSSRKRDIELVGPMRPDTSWQAKGQTGYDISHFVVDWDAKTVTCPEGKTSLVWVPTTNAQGDCSISVQFNKQECHACSAHDLCTKAKGGRGLRLQPSQLLHDSLQQARVYQQSEQFKIRYRVRAGIEGTISQATRSFELRRTRFIGHTKTRLQHLAIATAINLSRLNHWWQQLNRSETRTSALLELQPYVAL